MAIAVVQLSSELRLHIHEQMRYIDSGIKVQIMREKENSKEVERGHRCAVKT